MKNYKKLSIVVIAIILVVYFLGPRPSQPIYDTTLPVVPSIDQLSGFIQKNDQQHKIKPGNEAAIIWADSTHQQTEYAIVYLHGFSASKEEGNPVHLNLAKSLKANLYLSRLADHGIDTVAPMQYFTAERLWQSAKEAYAIGKQLGKKVILVGTSTGGTLALQLAANYPEANSIMLLSPNIAINDNKAWLLTMPWGLQMARLVEGGKERKTAGNNELYRKYWYTHYRLESVVQLQELVETTMHKELFAKVHQPVLLLYYFKDAEHQDPVVKVEAMLKMYDQLGTSKDKKMKVALPNAQNHVIGSYITSKDVPGVEKAIIDFISKMKL
ncbi:alpha/beta hydrolase [Pedobacter montanisoli]|uniref:Alpha/beta hydrolase n=1 Tax=Pedobacter montanisoli TaxID=2923277 RepID=A0ABS9ZRY0_9SPHI|nr:alpha/beta hydrolase [Pedobacter montanisoli]MCJ0741273.1 alpha/beta hydrolase [Pedobacter montanisoli]